MATWPLGNMQVKGAMGQAGSFALAEMPPGARGRAGTAHHHAQEQIVVGVGGSALGIIGGSIYRAGVYGAALMPSNSEHAGINGLTSGPSTFIEFQPVLRTDWFPPYPKIAFPRSPTPVAVPAEQRVFEDLDPSSTGWQSLANGARSKTLNGQTVRLTMWDLSHAGRGTDLNPMSAGNERFVYVFEGHTEIVVDSSGRAMAAQTLAIVSPRAKSVRLGSNGKTGTLVGVFESTQN